MKTCSDRKSEMVNKYIHGEVPLGDVLGVETDDAEDTVTAIEQQMADGSLIPIAPESFDQLSDEEAAELDKWLDLSELLMHQGV